MGKTAESVPIRKQKLRKVKVSDLIEAPWNHRLHGGYQKDAFGGTVEEIGWYGYPDVFKAEDGTLVICDGHLRREWLIEHYGEATEIEVNVVDFNEEEARKATLSKDALSQLADQDPRLLADLMEGMMPMNDFQLVLDVMSEHALKFEPSEYPAISTSEVTGDQIQETSDKLSGQYSSEAVANTLEVICPECMHEFEVYA